MAREIILYNLKDSVSDDEYLEYCNQTKGPLIRGLPSCKKFELIRIGASAKGDIPYKYVGVAELTSLEDWKRDAASEPFQKFLAEWTAMVSEFHILMGAVVYGD